MQLSALPADASLELIAFALNRALGLILRHFFHIGLALWVPVASAAQAPGGLHELRPASAQPRFETEGGQVHAIAVEAGGRTYAAGDFTSVRGESRVGLARFLADGSLDATYTPAFVTGTPFALALQPDGKLLVAGRLNSLGGVIRNGIFRLNEDGSLDDTFQIGAGFGSTRCLGSDVESLVVRTDGQIIAAGCMTDYNFAPIGSIARLNPDGSLDATFVTGTGFNAPAGTVAAQPDGRIVVGGSFTEYNGVAAPYLVRLNADGSRDTTFNTGVGPNGRVGQVALQTDGAIVVNGAFDLYNGTACDGFVRLLPDGTRDPTFMPQYGLLAASSVQVLADGDILLGGSFYSLDGAIPGRIARVKSNGSLDTSFKPGAGFDGDVFTLGVLPGGRIVVGGKFTTFSGAARSGLAWIDSSGEAAASPDPRVRRSGSVASAAAMPGGGWAVGGSFDFVDGEPRRGLARLNADGSLDREYVPAQKLDEVVRLAVDTSGRVLVCGWVQSPGGVLIHKVVRYTTNGAIDTGFNPGDFNDYVRVVLPTPEGVLVSGSFTGIGGIARNRLARFDDEGSLNATYDPPTNADGTLDALARQPDGKIITGGSFRNLDGSTRFATLRINPDGSLDSSYNGLGAGQVLNAIVIQPDGKIVTASSGFTPRFQVYGAINRFNSDGSLDPSFDDGNSFSVYEGFNGPIYALALQADGRLWVGGDFSVYRGYNAFGFARLETDGSLNGQIRWNDKASAVSSGGRATMALATNPRGNLLAAGTWMLSSDFVGGGTLAFPASTLVNLSIRSMAGTDENTLIVGLAMAGGSTTPVLFRAVGPTLVDFHVPEVLLNPRLSLFSHGASVPFATNDDWGGTTVLKQTFADVGAFPLPDTSLDAALVHDLAGATITAHITDPNGSGVALAEAYDVGEPDLGQQLVNLSARSIVGTGDNILILGFVVRGSYTRRLLIRGIGPTLSSFDVSGVLSDPILEIYRHGESTPIAQNDNWGSSPDLVALFQRTHAFELPVRSADAAVVVVLPPGIYTAHVRGKNGATGIALAEVYLVD